VGVFWLARCPRCIVCAADAQSVCDSKVLVFSFIICNTALKDCQHHEAIHVYVTIMTDLQ